LKLKKGFAIIFPIIIIVAIFMPTQGGFNISTVKDSETLQLIKSKSNEVTVGWRHSVELQPWQETYKVNKEGHLELVETRFKAYGAGVPDVDGHIERVENGQLVVKGINRTIDQYSLFYSPNSNYYVEIDGEKHHLKDFVPSDTAVNISYEKISIYEQLSF
jgi:hypothetical protein